MEIPPKITWWKLLGFSLGTFRSVGFISSKDDTRRVGSGIRTATLNGRRTKRAQAAGHGSGAGVHGCAAEAAFLPVYG